MKTVWTKGMKPQEKEEMKQQFNAAVHLRQRLNELLLEKTKHSSDTLRQRSNYENPSWAFQQADGIGYERALFEVISLISSDTVDK